MGGVLIIGLNSDESVRRLKGEDRPVNSESARALVLASLRFVPAVVLFGEDTPYDLIRTVQPDVLVKGGDYRTNEIVGHDVVTARGGRVVTLDFLPGDSTSHLIQKIRDH